MFASICKGRPVFLSLSSFAPGSATRVAGMEAEADTPGNQGGLGEGLELWGSSAPLKYPLG